MMPAYTRTLVVLATLAALTSGCLGPSVSRVDRHWGSALRDNVDAMVAAPEASLAGHDPGAISDGKSTELALARLRASQAPSAAGSAPTFNIGMIGTSAAQ